MIDPKKEMPVLARILLERPEIAATLISVAEVVAAVEYGEVTVKT